MFINPFEKFKNLKSSFKLNCSLFKIDGKIYVQISIYQSYEFGDYIRHIAKVGSQQFFETFVSLCHYFTSLGPC
jgi:hypothetical protein